MSFRGSPDRWTSVLAVPSASSGSIRVGLIAGSEPDDQDRDLRRLRERHRVAGTRDGRGVDHHDRQPRLQQGRQHLSQPIGSQRDPRLPVGRTRFQDEEPGTSEA